MRDVTPPLNKMPTNGPQASLVDSFIESSLLRSNDDMWGGLSFGYFEAADHDDTRHLWLPHPCIGVLTAGAASATIQSGSRRTEISIGSGTAGIFGPEFDVYRSVWHCRDAKRIFVELKTSTYERLGLADELLSRPLRQNLASSDPDLYGVLLALKEELQSGYVHGRLYGEALTQGLLRHVHRHYGAAAPGGRACSKALSRLQLERVRDYVRHHLDEDFGLDEMASTAGVSRAHFVRLFRNSFGQSPHAFVISERVRHARDLLATSDAGLADIAVACGFSSQSHFGTLFKQETGLTPRAFRTAFPRRGMA